MLLFFVIAPGVTLLLLWCGITRVRREVHQRGSLVVLTLTYLTLWLAASLVVLQLVFATAWGVAHTRPSPEGWFPEGWLVYGYLTAYAALGGALVRSLRTASPKQMTP